jgi:chemotaxis protein CheD
VTVLTINGKRITVGVGDMQLSSQAGDVVITHALGSCIGIALHDPVAAVGGILHFMLPDSAVNPQRAAESPWMFADVAIPRFFRAAYDLGAQKSRLIVKVAGGAKLLDDNEYFAIGKRNHTMLRKLFWQNGILIKGEHVGGAVSRTLYLEVGSGRTWLSVGGQEIEL